MEQPIPVHVLEATEEPVQGGYSAYQLPEEDEISMLLVLKSQVEEDMGKKYNRFVPTSVKSQCVAGTNYTFIVSVNAENEPNEEIDVRVFKPLPHTQQPPSLYLKNTPYDNTEEEDIEFHLHDE